jgi:hypothetical protein
VGQKRVPVWTEQLFFFRQLCVASDRFGLCVDGDCFCSTQTKYLIFQTPPVGKLEKGQTIIPFKKVPLFLNLKFLANKIDNPPQNLT